MLMRICRTGLVAVVLLFSQHGIGQIAPTLSVELKSNKSLFSHDEPILLEYIIRNRSGQFILFDSSPLASLPKVLEIRGPDGRPVRSQRIYEMPINVSPSSFVALPPGAFWGGSVDLLDLYPALQLSGSLTTFSIPGDYEIRMSLASNQQASGFDIWIGHVDSEAIVVSIKPLDEVEIERLRRELVTGSPEEKIRSIGLLQRYSALTAEEITAATQSPNASVRRAAAQAFSQTPNLLGADVLVAYLDSEDENLVGFAALTLGERQEVDAVPALIRAADPIAKPTTYRSAARALMSIGDPRAIEVLGNVVEAEPMQEMRSFFEKGYRDLLAKRDQRR